MTDLIPRDDMTGPSERTGLVHREAMAGPSGRTRPTPQVPHDPPPTAEGRRGGARERETARGGENPAAIGWTSCQSHLRPA